MHIRARALTVCALLVALFLVSVGVSAQDKKDQKTQPNQPKLSKEQIQERDALIGLVTSVTGGAAAPADIPVTFQNHFMRSREGKSFMPYTLAVEPGALTAPQVLLYVRAVKKGGEAPAAAAPVDPKDKDKKNAPPRVEYAWEDYYVIETATLAAPPAAAAGQPAAPTAAPGGAKPPLRISRYIGVAPGEYDVYFALRERAAGEKKDKNAPPGKTTILKQTVTAPDFNAGLIASSIIVVEKVEDLPTALNEQQLRENPYTFGNMKLTPALTNRFDKKGEISWIFVIYNAQLDATTKKPEVSVEYNFHQKLKDGEKYFNKTSPQNFSATTLPPGWDGLVTNQISAGQSVPLGSFPEGDYRLEVKVVDKLGNKTITENIPFTVVSGS